MAATRAFQPNNSPQGLQTLNEFVGGTDVLLQIVGFNGSTAVPSCFKPLRVSVSAPLPALNSTLLQSTALTSPSEQHGSRNVNLKNPFSAGLTITSINSTVTSHRLSLGTIQTSMNGIVQNSLSAIIICRCHLALQERVAHPNNTTHSANHPMTSFRAATWQIHDSLMEEFGDPSIEDIGTSEAIGPHREHNPRLMQSWELSLRKSLRAGDLQ
ncbi:hypothetical protein JB92DRAFT_3131855 [Gautieria morchelliformis]|nr:hypothetical protein JB92DRAFT_3131855 [Gautieria morchelliformis]